MNDMERAKSKGERVIEKVDEVNRVRRKEEQSKNKVDR